MPSDQFSNAKINIIEAYPPHLWDSKPRVMQPELDLRQGTRQLGAFLVEFHGVNCILIFGVTYWELTPWCEVIPTKLSTFRRSKILADETERESTPSLCRTSGNRV